MSRLRESLAAHYGRSEYLRCQSMGELVRENLESIRLSLAAPPVARARPDEVE